VKIECVADKRAWAEVKDVWTRNDVRRFADLFANSLSGKKADVDALREFYREICSDACVVDASGKEYRGVDEVFDADDLGDLDAAVAQFWALLPRLAYNLRASLGEAKRAG
jgi:hypothetical protein